MTIQQTGTHQPGSRYDAGNAKGQTVTMTPEQAGWFSATFNRLVANVDQVLLGKTFVVLDAALTIARRDVE